MKAVAQAIRRFEYDRSRGSFRGWLLTVTRSKLNTFFARRARGTVGTGDTALHQGLTEHAAPQEDAEWEL